MASEMYEFVGTVENGGSSKIMKFKKDDFFAIREVDEPFENKAKLKTWIRELLLLQNLRHRNIMTLLECQVQRDENEYIEKLFVKTGTRNEKVDLWSVGCIFFELLTGQPLLGKTVFDVGTLVGAILSVAELPPDFDQNSFWAAHEFLTPPTMPIKREPLQSKISAADFPSFGPNDDAESHNSENGKALLENLLQLMPEDRCSASEALRSPFLQGEASEAELQPMKNPDFVAKASEIMRIGDAEELVDLFDQIVSQDY
uniref:Protein kinase domain-containing protein n=1 Tax=Panagrolaimus sp. JU765 TaxID=591449 RepID=A0AC34QQ05_9BILA